MIRFPRALIVASLLAIAPLLAPHAPRAAATAQTGFVGPKSIYLVLGDSLAFGFQPNFDFHDGYDDDWFNELQSHGTTTKYNLACPGETTVSFLGLNGAKCPYRILRYHHYSGPQMQAALDYIAKNKGQISPVSIDIGANDFLAFFDPVSCSIITPTGGISQAISAFNTNYTSILSQIKTALGGTGDLFTMNYYDPFQNLCPTLVPFLQMLNSDLQQDAASLSVPVVDVFTLYGGSAAPNPYICGDPTHSPPIPPYTWMCLSKNPQDGIHPTTAGYQAIYQGFTSLAGY